MESYSYALNNPLKYIEPNGEDIAFLLTLTEAGGNGHTTLYFQDKSGQWYSYNQGAAGETSSGNLGFVSGSSSSSSTKTGVTIEKVDGPVKGSLLLKTSTEQDTKITISAFNSNYKFIILENFCILEIINSLKPIKFENY